MASVTDLTPYADRDAFPIMLTDGLRVRKTDDAYVVERLKSDLTWEALDVAGQATWGSIIGTLTDQSNVDTDDTLAADSDAKLATQKAVKAYVDNNAPGGGSFLSANTARVDPSGHDSGDDVGVVGDLSKPFLTVQGAIDAIVDLAVVDSAFVIDIGNNQFEEDVTVEAPVILAFVGAHCDTSSPFTSLTISIPQPSASVTIYGVNAALGNVITNAELTMFIQESRTGSITSTATGGTLTIGSYYNTGAIGEIIADDVGEIYIFGVVPTEDTSIQSANATEVTLRTVKQNNLFDGYNAIFSVTAPAAEVNATDSILGEVECAALEMLDSRTDEPPTVEVEGVPQVVIYRNTLLPKLGYDFNYDFDRDGGSLSGFELFATGEENIPGYFVVTGATLEVVTPLESENNLATVAIGTGEAGDDLQAATLVSAPPWDTAEISQLEALVKMGGNNLPTITAAIEPLTAGKFTLHIDGYPLTE